MECSHGADANYLSNKAALGVPVRLGSKANIGRPNCDVWFTADSGHSMVALRCPLSATSGHGSLFVISSLHAIKGHQVFFRCAEGQIGRI
jgi:hypothetical protein